MTNTLTSHETEEGLPEGWEVQPLSDLAEVQLGRSRSPKNHTGPSMRPYLRAANVTWGGLDLSDITEMNFTDKEMEVYRLRAGDILVNEASGSASEVGKAVIFDGEIENCGFQNHLIRVRVHSVDNNFLHLHLVHNALSGVYTAESRGIGINHLGKAKLAAWPIVNPPQQEQERIVEILEDQLARLDTALQSVHTVREKAAQFRRSLLHAAFTGALTGHDVEEGELPSGWALCKFNEIANVDSNLVDPKPFGHLPHIAPNNIEGGSGRLLDYRSTAEDGVTSGKHKFHRGHILYSKIRPYLNKVVVVDFEGLCSADMYPISTDQNINWLFMTMLGPSFVSQTSSTQTRTVLPKINIKELSRIEIPVPPLPEQERIVEILEDQLSRLDTALDSVRAVREKAAQFRRSLLHAAFTGALTGHDVEDGALPADWRQVSLVELLADQKYALAIGPFGSNLKRSDYQASGVPLVFIRNIRANDFDLSPVYVTPVKANDLSAHQVRGGDVLVTKMGDPPGDTTIYPADRPDAVITADCIKVTSDPEVVSNRYLSLVIDSPLGANQIRQMTGGVAQQKVNLAKFRKFQVPLAPRREQDQIVEILEDQLSRLDTALAVADAVEERSAALRRSLLHSAFTGHLTREWREAVNV